MWVKFKKNYSGPHGFFVEGQSCDLSEKQVAAIGKKFIEKTTAPWDAKINKAVVAKSDRQKKLESAKAKANLLQEDIRELGHTIAKLEPKKMLLDEVNSSIAKIEKEINDEQKIEEARKVEAARQAAEADAASKKADENSKGQDDPAGTGQSDPEVGKKKSVKPVAKKNKKK